MKIFLYLAVFSLFCHVSCQSEEVVVEKKINGVSYVASREMITKDHLRPLVSLGANYASVMPFAFMRSAEDPKLLFDTDRQWFGETYKGAGHYIQELHKAKIQVMLKPHMWIGRGTFTGDLLLHSEADWEQLETDYERYILTYARLAEENNVEIYCIGTELFNFVDTRPAFWSQLIENVKSIYKGKLTYAENWDKVDRNQLWENLDFIGVDAYFPVSDVKSPTIENGRVGWKPHKKLLKSLSKTFNKPILFTEYGYRSIDYAGKEPWQTQRSEEDVNLEAQANLTEALFTEFWNEPWFAGGFIWKWHHNHEQAGGVKNNRFTPQNKPTQDFLKQRFQLLDTKH